MKILKYYFTIKVSYTLLYALTNRDDPVLEDSTLLVIRLNCQCQVMNISIQSAVFKRLLYPDIPYLNLAIFSV